MTTSDELDALGLNDDPEFIVDPIERESVQLQIDARTAHVKAQQMDIIRGRKNAFTRVLRDGNASRDDIAIVLAVLRRFCRADTSTFHSDARLHAVAEGRREVWLLVQDYCERSMDELFNKLA